MSAKGAVADTQKRLVRRNYGTGHGYRIDGRKADGVTTVLSNSLPKPALVGWAAGTVGKFMYDSPAEVATMASTLGRDAFVAAMKELPSTDRDIAAKRGTEVHGLAELIAKGDDPAVPDELAGHVEAYLDFRRQHQPRNEMLEVTVGHLELNYAGTLDAWGHLPYLKKMQAKYASGRHAICEHSPEQECLSLIDIKTSRSGVWPETALQCAAYGRATHYIDPAGVLREMPTIDHYLSLWLRSDGWDLIPFDVTHDDWLTFLHCQHVAQFQRERSKEIMGQALDLPDETAA